MPCAFCWHVRASVDATLLSLWHQVIRRWDGVRDAPGRAASLVLYVFSSLTDIIL
jgi:hypothetical protein